MSFFMQKIERLLARLWPRQDPHEAVIVELSGAEDLSGRTDAVLALESGRSASLYLVPNGERLYGHAHHLVLIHCDSPEEMKVAWQGPSTLRISGGYDVLGGHWERFCERHDRQTTLLQIPTGTK